MPLNPELLLDTSCYRVDTYSSLRGCWAENSRWNDEKKAYERAGELRNQGKRVRIMKREIIETIIYED